jgi:DNA repair protein RadC
MRPSCSGRCSPTQAPRARRSGSRASIDLPVRRILEDALRLGSAGLVIAHNHPSGDAQPSRDDVESTRELADTAARLGIRLHDHLIFAGGDMCSLRSLGLL